MSNFVGDYHALLVLVLAGYLPNEIWRMLGLGLGGGIDESSEVLVWVKAVATAILAGVIAQMMADHVPRANLHKMAVVIRDAGRTPVARVSLTLTRERMS